MQRIKNIGKSILAGIYFPWLAPIAIKKINEIKNIPMRPKEAFLWTEEFIVGPKFRGLNINFKSSQVESEIVGLLSELEKNPPKIILEIGTATAGTLFMFTRVASDDALIISIDLPLGRYGAGYFKYRIPLLKSFAGENQKIELLRCDSHATETIEKLKKILNGRGIDFLFIDGDHSYDGVKSDFLNYKDFVKDGGIIAFHDIVENFKDASFGTQLFWKEIKNNYNYQEFIRENPEKNGCGIGLIKNIDL